MSDAYQTIRLGGEHRNAESLGDLVAWLITNNLLAPALEAQAGSEAARVKMQDLSGAAFLTTVLHGELKPEHLTDEGRKLCEHYLASGDYDRDYQSIDRHEEDDWRRYDAISPRIREVYRSLNQPQTPVKKLLGKIIQFPGKQ